jgi:hypothetical protein
MPKKGLSVIGAGAARGRCGLLVLALLAIVSCGHDSASVANAPARNVEYRGVFVRARTFPLLSGPEKPSGTITVSVVEAAARLAGVSVIGYEESKAMEHASVRLVVDGRAVVMSGRFDRTTGVVTASGNGIVVQGVLADGRIIGTLRWPDTSHAGRFITITPATTSIQAYVGDWSGTAASGADEGDLSFLIDGKSVIGVAYSILDQKYLDVEGTRDADGRVVLTLSSYTLTGTTTSYRIFGSYEASVDERRSGDWMAGPSAF